MRLTCHVRQDATVEPSQGGDDEEEGGENDANDHNDSSASSCRTERVLKRLYPSSQWGLNVAGRSRRLTRGRFWSILLISFEKTFRTLLKALNFTVPRASKGGSHTFQ